MNASTQNPAAVPTGKFVEVAIALVFNDQDQLLICRRKKDAVLGGFWEFPGGKCEATETLEACVKREVTEELAIEVTPVRALDVIEYRYPTAVVMLYPFICRHDSGEPVALCASEVRWVEPAALGEFQFPPANVGLLAMLSAARLKDGAIDLEVLGA